MLVTTYVLVAAGVGLVFAFLLSLAYRQFLKSKWGDIEKQKKAIVDEAEKTAGSVIREARIEAKDYLYQAKSENERDLKERRQEQKQIERRLRHKDESLERKLDQAQKREQELSRREREYNSKERQIQEKEASIDRLIKEQTELLERFSGIKAEDAKKELFKRIEDESKFEAARLAREIEENAKETADKKAKMLIGLAVQRYSSDYVADATVSAVSLPSDELKGRIIGREGRNIRAMEVPYLVLILLEGRSQSLLSRGSSQMAGYIRHV
jgi:ribonuclease Y